uniref:Uncharacterized protein n=1 Tax=Columba livia TaxID=8932 RepID=R7VP55_COLLI
MSAAPSHHCSDLSPNMRRLAQTIPQQVLSGLFPAQAVASTSSFSQVCCFHGQGLSLGDVLRHASPIINPSTTISSELIARKDDRGTNSGKERPTVPLHVATQGWAKANPDLG